MEQVEQVEKMEKMDRMDKLDKMDRMDKQRVNFFQEYEGGRGSHAVYYIKWCKKFLEAKVSSSVVIMQG